MGTKANDVDAGGASVRIGTDNKPFDIGLKTAEARLKAFAGNAVSIGSKLAGIGIGLGAGMFAAAKSFSDAGSALDDMSQRTGDTVENLSEIGYAAKMSGTELETVEAGLRKMSGTIAGALAGEKLAIDTLDKLGLTAADLEGKLPTEQLAILADGLAGISDNNVKIDLAKSLFGGSGADLIPLLNSGSQGIKELRDEAKRLGLTMSGEDAAAAAKMGDAMDELWASIGALVNTVGSALAPALTDILKNMTDVIAGASKWIAENKGLVIGLGMVAVAVTVVGVALAGLGVVAAVSGTALGVVAGAISFLLSPIGLVIAAGAGLVYAFFTWTEAGNDVASSLADAFGWIAEIAKKTFKGISDALAMGDVKSAMKVLWAGVKVVWQGGVDGITSMWTTAMIMLEGIFDGFVNYTKKGFADLVNQALKISIDLNPKIVDKELGKRAADLGNNLLKDTLDNGFANRQAGRDQRIVDAGKTSDKLIQLDQELNQLLADIKANKLGTKASVVEPLKQGRANAEGLKKRASDFASPEAAARGSASAAATIIRSSNLARANPNAEVEKLLRKISDILIKTGDLNVVEVRLQ